MVGEHKESPADPPRGWIGRRIAVDTCALAALRIALGSVLLVDLLLRSRSLVAFYSDGGVLPRALLRAEFGSYHLVSLHALWGSAAIQVILFVATGVAALALVVGYRTRLATLCSLVLLVSLQARNPLVLNAGDTLLRRLLFWSLFLPLGDHLAIDAEGSGEPRTVSGLGTAALLGQVVAVYLVNAAVKLRAEAWPSGRALALVFELDQFTVLVGDAVATVTPLLAGTTWLWLALLLASPLLLVLTGRRRSALAGIFIAGHAGMLVTIRIGIFPLVSIAALLPFLSTACWDRLWAAGDSVAERLWDWVPGAGLHLQPARDAPATVSPSLGRLRQPLLVVLLVAMLLSNASTVGVVSLDRAGVPEQSWDMFAPTPGLTDGWFVAPGVTTEGRQVDALAGRTLRWDRPPDLAGAYPSARWRKYLMQLRVDANEPLRRALADYLCDRWRRTHGTTLERVGIVFVAEPTRLGTPDPRERRPLGRYDCP